ncbi:hypothetical protein AB1Y20_016812 [Prymnesium parvum]|uniref:Polycystin cation channel PKD1/PKD2 domain-containing protein n=1 Tax=Prymnesium parvum TaxID=97485 RepID=A0AB34IC18_PRYPA
MTSTATSPLPLTLVKVHYCPNGEKVSSSADSVKVYLASTDTFQELQRNAEDFFGTTTPMCLKDEANAIYPSTHLATRHADSRSVVRLVKANFDMDDNESVRTRHAPQAPEPPEQLNVPEGRTHRKPLIRELVIHCIFTAALLCTNYVVVDSSWRNQSSKSVQNRLIYSEYTEGSNFKDIYNYNTLGQWMLNSADLGIFASDFDNSGSVLAFTRLVGGIEFKIDHKKVVVRNESSRNLQDTIISNADETFVEYKYVNPVTFNDTIAYALNESSGPRVVSGQLINTWNDILASRYQYPHNNSFNCNCYTLTNAIRMRFTLFCNNAELYVNSEFIFSLSPGGTIIPSYTFRVFPIEPPWNGLPPRNDDVVRSFKLLSTWLFIGFYTMVIVNTRTLNKAMVSSKRRTGSYKYFFMNGWTIVQILSNLLNYLNLALRVWYSYFGPRRDFDPNNITEYVNLADVGRLFKMIQFVSALCIFFSLILFILFFELAPKGSMWFVISATINRASSSMNAAVILCFLFISSFAIMANNIYGYRMGPFATVWRSITSMVRLLMGDDEIYLSMRNSRQNPMALAFMIVFLSLFYFVLLPLFISMFTDAYFLRRQMNDEILQHLKENMERQQQRQVEKKELDKKGRSPSRAKALK